MLLTCLISRSHSAKRRVRARDALDDVYTGTDKRVCDMKGTEMDSYKDNDVRDLGLSSAAGRVVGKESGCEIGAGTKL